MSAMNTLNQSAVSTDSTDSVLYDTIQAQVSEMRAKKAAAQLYIEGVVEHLPVGGECLNAALSLMSQAISLKRIADALDKLLKSCEQDER